MFFTYILKSEKDNHYYIGYTSNIDSRLEKHNNHGNKSTKYGIPWVVVFSKQFETKRDAIRFESYLKSLKSRVALEKYIAGWRSGISSGP